MTRTNLTFRSQFDDPAAGLAMAREGLEIAGRLGSTSYAFMMVGNAATTALRTGEWAWTLALLDEWLENEITGGFYLELYVDRGILQALSGGDPSSDLDAAEALLPGMEGDPQYGSYLDWGRAWAAFVAGDLAEAERLAGSAADATSFFLPIQPAARRAGRSLGRRRRWRRRRSLARLDASLHRGQALALDRATLRAGHRGARGPTRRGDRRLPRGAARLAAARLRLRRGHGRPRHGHPPGTDRAGDGRGPEPHRGRA